MNHIYYMRTIKQFRQYFYVFPIFLLIITANKLMTLISGQFIKRDVFLSTECVQMVGNHERISPKSIITEFRSDK